MYFVIFFTRIFDFFVVRPFRVLRYVTLYNDFYPLADMNEILSSQVHEHIFGDEGNDNLNGPRRLLAENLDYQQMELTTEDREDHTFNGKK